MTLVVTILNGDRLRFWRSEVNRGELYYKRTGSVIKVID